MRRDPAADVMRYIKFNKPSSEQRKRNSKKEKNTSEVQKETENEIRKELIDLRTQGNSKP